MRKVTVRDSESGFPYVAYEAEKLSGHPAIIFHLHGVGERGNGSNVEIVLVNGFPKAATDENLVDAVLIMPQCPQTTFWVAQIESLRNFMDNMIEKYSADTSRIYLAGLSMGGFGAWYTAQAYPDMFAAVAPCCGGGMQWYAGVLKMPIRAFHGALDDCVHPSETINMVNAVNASGGHAEMTIFENVGHGAWVDGLNGDTITWMLAQRK